MYEYDAEGVDELRNMARRGLSVADMIAFIKAREGNAANNLSVIARFRDAFGLGLPDAIPIVDYLKSGEFAAVNQQKLHELVWPAIESNRSDWNRTISAPAEAQPTPCPHCQSPLRTSSAKQCFVCGMDWHDPSSVIRRGSLGRRTDL